MPIRFTNSLVARRGFVMKIATKLVGVKRIFQMPFYKNRSISGTAPFKPTSQMKPKKPAKPLREIVYCPLTGWPSFAQEVSVRQKEKPTLALHCNEIGDFITSADKEFSRFFRRFPQDPEFRMNSTENVRVFQCAKGVQCICEEQKRQAETMPLNMSCIPQELDFAREEYETKEHELFHVTKTPEGRDVAFPIEQHVGEELAKLQALYEKYQQVKLVPGKAGIKMRQELLNRFDKRVENTLEAIHYAEVGPRGNW